MQPDLNEAISYTKEHVAVGVSESQLREHFLAHGWTPEHVDQIFAQLQAPAPIQQAVHESFLSADHSTDQPMMHKKRYSVVQGFKDGSRSIRANLVAYAVSLFISAFIAVAGTALLGYLLSVTLLHSFSVLFGSVASLIGILFTVLSIYLAWIAFAGSVIVAATSQAIADGYHGHKQPPLRQFQHGFFRKVLRMTIAGFVADMIVAAPLFLLVLLPVLALTSAGSYSLVQLLSLIFGVVTIIWIIVSCLRLAIVPHVALFEPRLTIKQTLKRSSALLRGGGQIYVGIGLLVLLVLYVITVKSSTSGLSYISGVSTQSNSVWLTIGFIVAELIANILLTVLYLDRAGASDTTSIDSRQEQPIIVDQLY